MKYKGFIGLGVMGNPMAGHLSKTFSTMVYNRTQSKTDAWLETYKGQTCTNPAELGKNCNEVFLCIGNDDDVRKIVSGEEGLLSEMQPGGIIVDHTTTSAELAREMHHLSMQKGVSYIDAPVSGGQAGAENGALTVMVGGDESDFKKAAEWLPKAMAVEPENPEIPVVMAIEIHAENEKWSDMVKLLNRAMGINPDKVIEIRGSFIPVKDAVNNYVEFYWAKEFNAGVEQFKKIQNDPDKKNQYLDVAINHFTNAATIKPSDSNTHTTLAKCYLDKGDKVSSKDAVITAVEKNPESFDANFSAGQILSRTGLSSKQVLPYYKKAVEIEPSNSKVLRELAGTYYDLGEKEESVTIFKNAISNESDKIVKADLYFNLGVIYSQMCDYEESEKAFDEAFFLNEEDFEAALGMARSYEGLGDNYLNGGEGCGGVFEKDFEKAARWFRKAEKKIKSVMVIDIDNKDVYRKNLELVRFKRDIAEGG